MPEDVYEVLSLGMRYWFVLLGVLIVWRAFGWLRKDRREKHRRLRQLPDAGMIGELVVLVGSDELPEGTVIPVPREGVLGFLRTCDVVVPVPGVQDHHLDFSFRNGQGLLIHPWRGCTCQVDADEMDHRSKPKQHPMHHGSRLFVGDAVLRLRVFAGLNVQRHVMYMEDEEPMPDRPPQPEQPETGWQQPPQGYQGSYAPDRWNDHPDTWHQYQPNAAWTAPADERAFNRAYHDAQPDAWQYQPSEPWTAPADERASTRVYRDAQPDAWQYQPGEPWTALADERASTRAYRDAQPDAWQDPPQEPWTAPADECASTRAYRDVQPDAWQYPPQEPWTAPVDERASTRAYRDVQPDAWQYPPRKAAETRRKWRVPGAAKDAPVETEDGQEDDPFDVDMSGDFDYAAPRVRRRRRSRDET